MAGKVKAIPEGYHSITPYLIVQGGAAALEFYKKAFGATELMRFPMPSGKIAHAEMKIGDSLFMLADEPEGPMAESPDHKVLKGPSSGTTPIGLMLYVEDVDSVAKQAVSAGAKELRPPTDQFYGDRSGTYQDPFGHVWTLSTHVEDVSPEEMMKRAQQQGH